MRKEYVSPEMETVKFAVRDVILASIVEETIPEVIGGGGSSGGEIIGDDL